MKIYKLDIDTSKPIRKVVQMQQNSTGALSIDVTNDGWPIRNLSCALYEGDTELSAYAELSTGAGYKIGMGADTKVVKFTAKSTPVECSAQYVLSVSGATRTQSIKLNVLQLEAGTYKQDEFYGLGNRFGNVLCGLAEFLNVDTAELSNANFDRIVVTPWNKDTPVWFYRNNGILDKDQLIVVTGPVNFYKNKIIGKKNYELSAEIYPAVGYWTDYSLDTVIRPSENAHCYAEQEVTDPEPEPTPDPEEPVEP